MERIARYWVRAIPVGVFALLLTSCGGGSNTAGTTNTSGGGDVSSPIGTSVDGARAAAAAVRTARDIAPLGVMMAGMADTAIAEIGTVSVVFIPVTFSCSTRLPVIGGDVSTPNSVTVVNDPISDEITATFNTCRSGAREADGTVTIAPSGGVTTFTLGTAAAPFTVTEYGGATSLIATDVFRTSAVLSYGQSATARSLNVTGWVEKRDFVRHTHDRYDFNAVSISLARSASMIGIDSYDDYTLTLDGSAARTAHVSDIDATVTHSEAIGFTGFVVVYRTPSAGSAALHDFLGINGDFSITTVPAGLCLDGAFSIVTNSEIRIVKSTGMTVGGELSINGNAIATFNADGSVSVGLAGGPVQTITELDLTAVCGL